MFDSHTLLSRVGAPHRRSAETKAKVNGASPPSLPPSFGHSREWTGAAKVVEAYAPLFFEVPYLRQLHLSLSIYIYR